MFVIVIINSWPSFNILPKLIQNKLCKGSWRWLLICLLQFSFNCPQTQTWWKSKVVMDVETKILFSCLCWYTNRGIWINQIPIAILLLHHKFFPKSWCLPHICIYDFVYKSSTASANKSNILTSYPSLLYFFFFNSCSCQWSWIPVFWSCCKRFWYITSPANKFIVLKLLLIGFCFRSRVILLDVTCHPAYLPCTSAEQNSMTWKWIPFPDVASNSLRTKIFLLRCW